MRAHVHNVAIVHHHDLVCFLDCRQSVRHDQDGPAHPGFRDRLLYQMLRHLPRGMYRQCAVVAKAVRSIVSKHLLKID